MIRRLIDRWLRGADTAKKMKNSMAILTRFLDCGRGMQPYLHMVQRRFWINLVAGWSVHRPRSL